MRCRPVPAGPGFIHNGAVDENQLIRASDGGAKMKILSSLLVAVSILSGCISSSSPSPPPKTTVVVPQSSGTTVVCQDGSTPPC
jgi:hypothetical protein